MADLNIPNINKKTEKYIFKNKLNIRRKPRRRLLIESAFMFALSLLIIYINYLIPNKNLLLENLLLNLNKSLALMINLFSSLYEILLVIFIFTSSIISFILILGAFYRLFRIANRKTKQINYK